MYVAASDDHVLCTTADGSLFAWGWNSSGQLGVGDTEDRRVPTLVIGLQGKQVGHVAAGQYRSICTTAEGSAFTWGASNFGQLGVGEERSNKLVPTLVRGELLNKALVQVAAGDEHSFCVVEDGLVYSWGNNDRHQLGVTGVYDADVPVRVQVLDLNANT